MLNGLSKILCAVILGLVVWSWWQSSEITSLKTTNHAQAQTITELQQVQRHLEIALKQEQQANERQQQLANQLRKKSEQARDKVKVILQKEPCGVTAMPSDVIDSIKRLHHKGKD